MFDRKIKFIIIFLTVILLIFFITTGGYLYWQKQKIVRVIADFSVKSNQEAQNKVISGKAKILSPEEIVIEVENTNLQKEFKKIKVTMETKIYQDFTEAGKIPELVKYEAIKINSDVVIGLTGSKFDKELTAEVIHIRP